MRPNSCQKECHFSNDEIRSAGLNRWDRRLSESRRTADPPSNRHFCRYHSRFPLDRASNREELTGHDI